MTEEGYNEIKNEFGNIANAKPHTLYTGEFYFGDGSRRVDCSSWPQKPRLIYRKSRDTYVFLKDYKPKIAEIITRLGRLESHFNYYRKILRKENKDKIKRGKEKEKLLNERIEKLEKVEGAMKKSKEELNVELDEVNEIHKEWEFEKRELNERIEKLDEEKQKQNERIEKLEKQVYDLLNPPIKPEQKNPFDYDFRKTTE